MIEANRKSNEMNLLIESYGELANDPKGLVEAVLNDTASDDMRNGLSKEKRLVLAISNYIEKCNQDPHIVMYYIIKSVAEGQMSANVLESFFGKYLNNFPATEFLQGLSEEDCKEILKENPDLEEFRWFFLYKIMNDKRVQMRILKTATERQEPFSWQAMLLHRLHLDVIDLEDPITGIRGLLKKLLKK